MPFLVRVGHLDGHTHERPADVACLLFAAVLGEPSGTLGYPAAQPDDDQGREQPESQHDAPRGHMRISLEDHHPGRRAQQDARRLQTEGGDQPPPTGPGGQDLRQIAGGDRVVQAHRDAQREPEDHEGPDIPRDRAQRREDDEQPQVDPEDTASADPVAQRSQQRRTEHRAHHRRGGQQTLLDGTHREVRGDQRIRHTDDEEVETVEQNAEPGQQPEPEVQSGNGGAVQRFAQGFRSVEHMLGRRSLGGHVVLTGRCATVLAARHLADRSLAHGHWVDVAPPRHSNGRDHGRGHLQVVTGAFPAGRGCRKKKVPVRVCRGRFPKVAQGCLTESRWANTTTLDS